jgi:hypothetical protein
VDHVGGDDVKQFWIQRGVWDLRADESVHLVGPELVYQPDEDVGMRKAPLLPLDGVLE